MSAENQMLGVRTPCPAMCCGGARAPKQHHNQLDIMGLTQRRIALTVMAIYIRSTRNQVSYEAGIPLLTFLLCFTRQRAAQSNVASQKDGIEQWNHTVI